MHLAKRSHCFLLAFLVPLVVRSVPEVLAGPYPIGFDTLVYVEELLSGRYLRMDWLENLRCMSLFYMVASAVGGLLGDAILTMKVLGPVLFASLCGSLYVYANKSLRWAPSKALGVSLLAGTYFVSLRISWEMYRQMLGFIFLMAGLVGLRLSNVRLRVLVVGTLGFLMAWSHGYAAVFFFIAMATRFLAEDDLHRRATMVLMLAPALLVFIYQLYSPGLGIQVPYESVAWSSWIDSVGSISGFISFMFLPLLPLALVGAFSFRGLDPWSWLGACLLFSYWPALLPEYSMLWWFRWAILLVYPIVFLSVEGLAKLWVLGKDLVWKMKPRRLMASSILLLNLMMSSYYLTSLPEHQIKYFAEWNNYKPFIQTSMLQNSISLSDMPDVVEAMKWLDQAAEADAVLVLHEAMAHWARILIPKFEIVSVGEAMLSSSIRQNCATRLVQLAAEKAATGKTIYTVWWVDGKGWYSMPEVPPQFIKIQRFSNIGIFQYSARVL